jgi:hypothetical protein
MTDPLATRAIEALEHAGFTVELQAWPLHTVLRWRRKGAVWATADGDPEAVYLRALAWASARTRGDGNESDYAEEESR